MPSFDTVMEPDLVEVRNALDQSNKEIGTRFDFKGSDARIELTDKGKDKEITLYADSEFQLGQVKDILMGRLARRQVDVRFVDATAKVEKMGSDKVRQPLRLRAGIEQDLARRIVALVKSSKLKVQASIQGSSVRMQGAKRDDLQAVIALLRKDVPDAPLSFNNFRD